METSLHHYKCGIDRKADVADVDPVTTQIIRNSLNSAAEQMKRALCRTAMSPVIYEVLDFACGVLDTKAQLIVQTNGITLFTGTFAFQLKAILKKFGDNMAPGDVYMTNDPFEGGTHTCDVALIRPLYSNGALRAFAIAVAHWSEVGGSVAGSIAPDATEIYQEGVRFPGIRICRNDEAAAGRPVSISVDRNRWHAAGRVDRRLHFCPG